MSLELLVNILLYCVTSLAILAVFVVWIFILAAAWITVNKFFAQYQASKRELERKEQVLREAARDDII